MPPEIAMGEVTGILWTDHTFNPWEGCQKVGPGCDHCFAEARNARFGGGAAPNWGPDAPRRLTSRENWNLPRRWNRAAIVDGRRDKVFCASLADVFDNAVDPIWRANLFDVVDDCKQLDWQILTKRIGNAEKMVPLPWRAKWPGHVWLIITVVNQTEADRDIPKLIRLKQKFGIGIVGLSIEPLLGPLDISAYLPFLDWVIVGGESGNEARPMHPAWVQALRDQCAAAGVAFFFKQWGEWAPSTPEAAYGNPRSGWRGLAGHPHVARAAELYPEAGAAFVEHMGKAAAGRLLDGVLHSAFPEVRHDLR
jgi:protein gp37